MKLVIALGLLDRVFEHARGHYPQEACGLLVGRDSADRFIPMTNALASSNAYEMDSAQLIATLREWISQGKDTGSAGR